MTFWNDRVGRVDPTREGQPLRWIFGPLKASSDHEQKWCDDCYGVVVEEGQQRWCRACKASESIADPAQQGVIDDLVRAAGAGVREWLRHREHVWCDECKNGGLPTFEQRIAKEIETALTGRAVVDLPVSIVFADEHTDVKTWKPDGVDFQVNVPSWRKYVAPGAIALLALAALTTLAVIIRHIS